MKIFFSLLALSVLLLSGTVAQTQGLPLGSDIPGTRLDWHPNDTMLALSDGQTVKIVDANSQIFLNTLPSFAQFVTDVKWSPDGSRLAVASGSNIQIWSQPWNAATADLEITIQSPANLSVAGIILTAWHPNGDRLLGVNPPNVYIWDAANGQLLQTFEANKTPLLAAGWSSNGNQIAYANTTGLIVVEDLVTGDITSNRVFDRSSVRSLVWNQVGTQLASGTSSGIIQLSFFDGVLAGNGTLETGMENIIALDWHPNGFLLASGSLNGTLTIWDTEARLKVDEFVGSSAIASTKWDSTGSNLAYSDRNGIVRILRLPITNDDPDQTLIDSDRVIVTVDATPGKGH